MIRILTLGVLLLGLGTAQADTQRGIELFNAEKYAAAEQEFLGPVAAGDPVAIRYYANMLYFTRGVDQDRPRAKELLRKAYENGDRASGAYLAELLTDFFGNDMPTKPYSAADIARMREAMTLIEQTYKGPARGAPATKLVNIYMDTEGKLAPKTSMITWFKRATQEGDGVSAWNLAKAYSNGNGVTQNSTDTLYWAELAAFLGHGEALGVVGEMYFSGTIGPAKPDQGVALMIRGAEKRDAFSMLLIAEYYASKGRPKDEAMAYRVLKIALERGMKETDRSNRLLQFLRQKSANISARSIEDYQYNGRFESLIQSTKKDYTAAFDDFKTRFRSEID